MTHFSYSQIAKYAQCPKKWAYEYKDDIAVRSPSWDARSKGKLVHMGIESYLLGADWKQVLAQEYMHIVAHSPVTTDYVNEVDKYTEVVEKTIQSLKDTFGEFEVLEIDGVPAIEYKFEVPIVIGKRKVNFVGIIDLVIKNAEGIWLVDWKTTKAIQTNIAQFQQGAIYQYIMEAYFNIQIDGVYYYQVKREPPKRSTTRAVLPILFTFNMFELKTLWDEAVLVMRRMLNSRLIHRSPSWLCGMCDFKAICDAHVAQDDNTVQYLMQTQYKDRNAVSGGEIVINGN